MVIYYHYQHYTRYVIIYATDLQDYRTSHPTDLLIAASPETYNGLNCDVIIAMPSLYHPRALPLLSVFLYHATTVYIYQQLYKTNLL